MHLDIILAELHDRNPDAYLFDNLDAALVGLGCIGHNDPVAVYSQRKIHEKLSADGFSPEDIEDYFSKLVNTGVGDNTPVILHDMVE